ncbi:hypothetical protein DNTS_029983 [Danionella cerebrum]|uniref:Wiskott-Aldrich syndrome protein family member n=1 Tax=Danionella cerebrum TaxID=2873325 RepID=A0A553QFP6_9TELE|nr:hypothetical protein DNTS_029983 [Danionella translucida]
MPLVKRTIEPKHLSRGALPESISNELECVNNNTLSTIIRQLSSLSKHAEDVFGELFNEANTFYLRANSLQDRIDRLAIKVTQLDSSVEEVSLQDINMRKAFKSSTAQDQQVVSKSSVPKPITDMYNSSDEPPPLNILSQYRDDHVEGIKFYTDPSYFFDLWKEKMLQDTEHKRKEKRKHREQKRCVDGTLPREVKKVRKAHNRRQEWNMMALDKELRSDNRHHHHHSRPRHRGASSEGSLSPDGRPFSSSSECPIPVRSQTHPHAFLPMETSPPRANGAVEHEYHVIGAPAGPDIPHRGGSLARTHAATAQCLHPENGVNGNITNTPIDYGSGPPLPLPPLPLPPAAPLIPSPQTAFASPPATPHAGPISSALLFPLPPLPSPGPTGPLCSPADGPALPPAPPVPPHPVSMLDGCRLNLQAGTDARSDLLSAIRMGIQLKKVQEQQEQQAKREPVGNDVATILSRRIAVDTILKDKRERDGEKKKA